MGTEPTVLKQADEGRNAAVTESPRAARVETVPGPRFAGLAVYQVTTGAYRGEYLGRSTPDGALLAQLAGLGRPDTHGEARSLSAGPHAVTAHELHAGGSPIAVVAKSFSRAWWRDRDFARNGSKACRSFRVALRLAENGVGTPRPVAWLDRWERGRLMESRFVCELESGSSFRDELNRLYREDPLCRRVLALLQTVAEAVARMHDAGVCHLDLGNQNILVQRHDAGTWGNVRFIDLDRARLHDRLGPRQRARDLSRLDIPSALLPVFFCMYFDHQRPPPEFTRWEARYRKRFALHTASRKLRHPIRTLRASRREEVSPQAGPGRKHLWLWDDLSEQAIGTRTRRERQADYPWRNGFYVAKGVARAAGPVRGLYRDLLAGAFRRPVAFEGRIGMTVGRSQGHGGQERLLLEGLGPMPVLIRIYRHAAEESNAAALAEARRMKQAGHSIYLALVQDRACIRDASLWERFVAQWLRGFSGIAGMVEIGHATNREKFGIRDFREYARLVETAVREARAAGGYILTGPAAIDFEYQALAGLLEVLPKGSLDALSHHLYVDRRGSPENRQGPFSAVEKFALAKAVATWSDAVQGDRLIVSEVSWPIAGMGVHSPVSAPYIFPNPRVPTSAVDEETYASFMIRYYALALCSGLVDKVYWWRLVARGFGLVDDTHAAWRPRPAYAALKQFLDLLGKATFLEKLRAEAGIWALRFHCPTAGDIVMAWSHPEAVYYSPPFSWTTLVSWDGRERLARRGPVLLTGRPQYFVDAR